MLPEKSLDPRQTSCWILAFAVNMAVKTLDEEQRLPMSLSRLNRILVVRTPEGNLNFAYVMIRNPRVDQIVLRVGAAARGR